MLFTKLFRTAALAAVASWLPPVDGPITRPFSEPTTSYGPGHRGVDFAAPPGSPVRSVAPGTVTFAGRVAGITHVAVAHAGSLTSSYSFLASAAVRPGDAVSAGETLGTAGGSGPGHQLGTLHFGVRKDGRYLDPRAILASSGGAGEVGGYTCRHLALSAPGIHTPALQR